MMGSKPSRKEAAVNVIPDILQDHKERLSVLFMRLGERWFALPTANVVLIAPKGNLTRVPMSPPHLLGIASVRGRLMTVIHLETLLGKKPSIDQALPETLPRLVVVTSGQDELAIVADEIEGIYEQGPFQERDIDKIQGLVRAELDWKDKKVSLLDLVRLVKFAIERATHLFTQGRIDA